MKTNPFVKTPRLLLSLAVAGCLAFGTVQAGEAKISPTLSSVTVEHQGQEVVIQRNQDPNATLPEEFSKTGRFCPPFCVQPMQILPGVETVGELELLGYLKRISEGDSSLLVVDSRTPEWVSRGTIPGSVNVPWSKINVDVHGSFEIEAEAEELNHVLHDVFGAKLVDGQWDFQAAKTLILFCNGPWCPQSSVNLKTLAKMGYPLNKLKWYRGGMQDWFALGLTTVP
jgi:rhodanese-related sulfurtransferase